MAATQGTLEGTPAHIKKRVREICQQADLDTLTERGVRQALSQELGSEVVEKQKVLISAAINEFLNEEEEGGEEDEELQGHQQVGKKRPADSHAHEGPSKQPRVEGQEFIVPLSGLTRLTVRTFKGRLQVDLRTYYLDKASGTEKPSDKGLALSATEWQALSQHWGALASGLESEDTDVSFSLSESRRAYVSSYQGRASVHVRELYAAPDGDMKPGKKGVSLGAASLDVLQQQAAAINAHVQKLGGSSAAAAPAPALASGSTAKAASLPAASVQPAGTSRSAQGAGGAAGAGSVSEIDLGGNKRITVSTFKNAQYVDMREWYSAGGTLKPGKKGISLKLDEWKALASASTDISRALANRDMTYSLRLADKRKVTLSTFKGTVYVGVREFYLKDGQELPGSKGLSMNEDQWRQLAHNAAAFSAGLGL